MEVAVIGGGHGGYAAAAEISEHGHTVRFWRRNAEDFQAVLANPTIRVKDFKGERDIAIARPTTSLGEAVKGAELIVIPLPATTQESLAVDCAPFWEDGQVVFLPPGTFGSYIYLKAARDAGNLADVTFCETGTLPYLARKHGPAHVVVSGYGKHLPTGCLPARNSEAALAKLCQVYPAVVPIEDGLSGALMNAGGIIHPPLIMMNAGPLEHFESWDIYTTKAPSPPFAEPPMRSTANGSGCARNWATAHRTIRWLTTMRRTGRNGCMAGARMTLSPTVVIGANILS